MTGLLSVMVGCIARELLQTKTTLGLTEALWCKQLALRD